MKKCVGAALLALVMASQASAAVLITEVASWGSDASYGSDWFELTNTGPGDVSLTGWKVDDSSNMVSAALVLNGVPTLPAGKSAIFFESNDDGSNVASKTALFVQAWFGGTAPAGFLIGAYGGSGIGLSGTSGDAVNIYDGASALVARVTFGAATANITFDNTAGINNAAISTLAVAGVNGAFLASGAVGSPGAPVPEPATAGLVGLGGLALLAARRRFRAIA